MCMCGRFTQHFSRREHELLDLVVGDPANLPPRYNVAPGKQDATVFAELGEWRFAMMLRGLIPSWTKEPQIGRRLINVCSETAWTKSSFRSVWRLCRCHPGGRILRVDGEAQCATVLVDHDEGRWALLLRWPVGALVESAGWPRADGFSDRVPGGRTDWCQRRPKVIADMY